MAVGAPSTGPRDGETPAAAVPDSGTEDRRTPGGGAPDRGPQDRGTPAAAVPDSGTQAGGTQGDSVQVTAPTDRRQPFSDGTIGSFLELLAGAEPVPGGGSAAALAGALAAALVSMVGNLTLGKEKYAAVEETVAEIKREAERLRGELTELVTLDALAYGAVAAAMKLPRGTEAEKEERAQALQAALVRAAEVPLRVAEAAAETARLSLPAAELGNPNAVSDAGCAALLAGAAAQAAGLNVRINLAWIADEEFKGRTSARLEVALSESARLRGMVLAVTHGKI